MEEVLQGLGSGASFDVLADCAAYGDGVYFGLYAASYDGMADMPVIGGGAVDGDGNLLVIVVIGQGEVPSDDMLDVMDCVSVG